MNSNAPNQSTDIMKNPMLLMLLKSLLLAPLVALHADEPPNAREVPVGFVKTHCSECHDGDAAEGGFRADLLRTNLADAANHKAWSRVLARVQCGEMPPPDTERPAEAEIVAALAALKTAFHE